jgi:hypothetical protein|tara:strand:+ start:94 stop:237 length:144 start_codon:yes stop_codon:yes gene_type:complete
MKLNGSLMSERTSEWVRLRAAWKTWNDKCHYEDKLDWQEYYDEHKKY